ncbi:hybrid sensor histidine kinase/response regulator [Azospirillum sp. B21]|uniref:ATP-binding response regulator n=1 Tax=Azospirillum sp. B21 TaxID=2607496 RepID=UPI0011EBD5B5|nr:hybrid sensor histidine kinase/response regulator [Azospirillum sp. B21]KAA0577288.1 hybrid sensor histidine kinase/response regulator [Azospirillum sp. B21]
MNGSQDDADCPAPPILVFGVDGRLADWSPAAEALPGLAGRLAAGMSSADLEEQAGPGAMVVPLASGGAVWRLANLTSSTTHPVPTSASADSPATVPAVQPMHDPAGRLFAAASHDLRQPLAALSLLIGTLDGRLKEGRTGAAERSGRDLLHSMAQAVESMRSMVDGHFDLVRLESGLVEPDIRTHAVNGVLMRLALDVAPRFADRGVRFSVMPCSAVVRTDSALLERLLHGLVANALRVTAHGRVLVGCRTRGDRLRIEVWDSGRGLSPQRLEALRTELARPAGEGSGTLGLDLTLVRGLARKLGFGLEVCSAEGRGTVFAVIVSRSVEAAEGAGKEEPLASAAPEGGGADISRTRILVIEDDPMVLAALEALLSQWGCSVVGTESYDAAVERIGPTPDRFDLIISDLRLKGAANGIVAIRQIAKLFDRPVPGMILTGDTDPKRLREARLSGYPLLHKPVAPLALRTAVIHLLGHDPL